ncbi:acetamidase/formamidase family protein [Winogradskyella sp. DF17]|uniref:Acetamidase/formamidase family protein n=1 Tax=Winogradskyella pelagia TaxID=2819984 RepID=A0ABS3T1Y3_9FLAO|nr:acetamidase/formamidase family protein [Winogradskyella sp. DF17]MBO3116757.1 acetamidase/formamidase family protein [Winogradskyella sp. DF17]
MKQNRVLESLLIGALCLGLSYQCKEKKDVQTLSKQAVTAKIVPQYTLTKDQTHNKFSNSITPILTVDSGTIIEAYTEDASDEQFNLDSGIEDLKTLDFEPIHPLTGPVFVKDAKPGDVLKVTLHEIEIGDWGWNAIYPGFSFVSDSIKGEYLRIYNLKSNKSTVNFNDSIQLKLNPFPGVMGVAPATSDLLNTIPPRANGGNMDDPNMTVGTSVYFPIFIEGGLFSIGDGHAVQGLGEVCGTAIEVPLRVVYEIELIKDKSIKEPQYETKDYYATTGFGTTLDIAAKKATLYMVDYLMKEHQLSEMEAYALCSLAGNLKIAETVDLPHMLVTMHMSKEVLGIN